MLAGIALTEAVRQLVLSVERYRLQAARTGFSVGSTEMMALSHLFVAGSSSPTELARRLQMTTASGTELVDRLAKAGHVQREPHPTDRRRVVITLTGSAHETISTLFGRATAVTTRCAEELTPAHRDMVAQFLAALVTGYEQAIVEMTSPGRN